MLLKKFSFAVSFIAAVVIAHSQIINKTADNAFVITRMVAKYHIQPRIIDSSFSADFFKSLIEELDDEKIIFSQEDIKSLSTSKNVLHTQLLSRKTDFLQQLIKLYQLRLLQTDSVVNKILSAPLKYDLTESYTAKEDSAFALNEMARKIKIAKQLKLEVLNEILPFYQIKKEIVTTSKNADSLETEARNKILHSFKRKIQRIQIFKDGITGYVCEQYCMVLAKCFDPHTEFFSMQENENFQQELGDKRLIFGFTVKQAKDAVVIGRLLPGSPAFKCGQINEGDKIQSLQWENKEAINVSDATVGEVSSILAADNHSNLNITVKKIDGSIKLVTLHKEVTATDDELGKVKGFILNGTKKIGFISLPAFYTEWEDAKENSSSCANDVAKEIIKLKKENIEGLIIDLRYNGGGSMFEAVELAGLFIDAGAVGMIKEKDGQIITLKDINRGTAYDGPLMLMVNGYSASASEMMAGTLQDYNRAVIAGTPTFGKATAQVVFPLDTLIELENINTKHADNFLKITVSKLFRVTGASAQQKGIQPDVLIPDLSETSSEREANEQFSINAGTIAANKYYHPFSPLPVNSLQSYAREITDTSFFFKALKKYLLETKKEKQTKEVPLHLKPLLELTLKEDENKSTDSFKTNTNTYSVQFTSYETMRMKNDENLHFINERWKEILNTDPSVNLCYLLVLKMIK